MDWDNLRLVLTLARHGSLSAAAGALGVTHTTVARRLKALEDDIGVRLFDRTPEGYVPTPAGLDMQEVAARLEADVLRVESRVRGRDGALRGPLRITGIDFAFTAFTDVFDTFVARHPHIEVTMLVTDDRVSLKRREADIALRLSDAPGGHLVGTKLGRVVFAPYASRNLAGRVGADVPLAQYPWIGWDARASTAEMDAWLAQYAPGAEIRMRLTASPDGVMAAVRAGLGVHFLPRFIADADPDFIRVGPADVRFGRDLWLLTLDELRTSARVRAFLDHAAPRMRARIG